MTNKAEETYDEIFATLKHLLPQMNPTDVTVDFEKAAINAINKAFPMAEIHGCRFHLGQSVYRHVQQVGLQSVYRSDPDFALQIRLLTALSFVPPENVVDAYDELMTTEFFDENTESQYKDQIQALVQYFQTTYVYRVDRRGQRKPPLFPPSLWNVYEQTLTGIIENCIEFYNTHFLLPSFNLYAFDL